MPGDIFQMKIVLNKNEKTPVYLQIADQVKNMIYAGIISDGYVLPSERKLAAELGIHRNTVSKAYDELCTEDIITSSQGRCYSVNFSSKAEKGHSKHVSWEALMRREYEGFTNDFDELYAKSFDSNFISFAGGVAAREPYPPEEIADVFEKILKNSGDKAYFYVPYQGDPELISEISRYMGSKGIRANASNVQVFSENNQALDFLLNLTLSKGDTILIDRTMSADVYRTIELAGGRIITIPSDENGIICDNLDIMIEKQNPKYIYVDSSFNNPTGSILPVERRRKLLEASYKYRVPIIEEDEGSELYYGENPVPSIKSMDRGDNVIYMYSFSLTMVPGIGVSFVIADKNIVEQFKSMVSLRIANPDWAAQMVMLEYMKNGLFTKRLGDFRNVCMAKRDRMCERLDRLVTRYGLEYKKPEGGVYLWVRLPGLANSRKLLEETQKCGMTFMPGYVFYSRKTLGRNYFRLNFSYPTYDEIDRGMDILEKAMSVILR